MRRVAVTGIGIVSPLGNSRQELFASLAEGRSAVRRLTEPWCARLLSPIAAPSRFDGALHFPPPRLRMLDRASQLALVAAASALADAGLSPEAGDARRTGVFIGTGMGGSQTMDDGYRTLYGEASDRIRPQTILMGMYSAPASWIAIDHGFRGPNLTFTTACSSSTVAIGEAWLRIRTGDADVMLAGGTEAPLTLGALKAWEVLRTLATADPDDPAASCKPFSRNRSGMVLGEGAAVVVLEAWESAIARGATIHAELVGYGLSTDSAHITHPTIAGQAEAIRLALASAALAPSAIGYINAHGTGTLANDPVETAAIKEVFAADAQRIPVSSTKSMHGHLLGAAGALEFVVSMMPLQQRILPPTMHLDVADPQCDLDYVPNRARANVDVEYAMTSSFAFGGTNAVLVLKKGSGSNY